MHISTDTIEKQTLLRATRARVWRALTDSSEFGSWFGMRVDGQFAAGAVMRCVCVPTTVDPEVAAAQQPHEGQPFEIVIERMEPERSFAFRWHPVASEQGPEAQCDPPTLITFTLDDVPDGTRLTVTESGFDQIPLARRAQAFSANESGWTIQMKLIEKYLALTP
ncbi:MAG: SRPBCC family protein [Fimbriimonadaceae bacterium]